MFYWYIHGLYLLFTIRGDSFRYLSANFIMSILFDLIFILLFLNLPNLWWIFHHNISFWNWRLHVSSYFVIDKISNDICNWFLDRLYFILLFYYFKYFGHVLFEIFEVRLLFTHLKRWFFIQFWHNVIKHTHDQIIIVSILSIFKDYITIRKIIVA